jgi:hypothetical protein
MMKHLPLCTFRWLPFILGVLVLLIFACRLTNDERGVETISFSKNFDNLAQFDSVTIVLKDTTGRTIDIVYRGRVDTLDEIDDLRAPHWDGGIVVVSITGFKNGETVYLVNTKFNGNTNKRIDSIKVILPGTGLAAYSSEINLTEGDSVPLPEVKVTPQELSDKSLSWSSSAPQILHVGVGESGYLKALARGTAHLTASLKSNPAKTLSIGVTVHADPTLPDSLILSPDSLFLAARGGTGKLSVRIVPASSNSGVTWILRNPTVVDFPGDGVVQGIQQGGTWAIAVSQRKPTIMDSCLILVSAPVPVEHVRFLKNSSDLFLKGAAESLIVVVAPPKSNPKVDFEILDSTKAAIMNGKIFGVAEGLTWVVARSSENPSITDTLKIMVFPSQVVDSVRVNRDSLKLFTGGEGVNLIGQIYPATAMQSLLWRSQNSAIITVDANGKVSPITSGASIVIAESRVDSSKKDSTIVTVKKDVPKLDVGRDTVISIGTTLVFRPLVAQEYGAVTQFKWDLDGDGVWEGTSDSLKTTSYTFDQPKAYAVGFYIRDTEGNDTTVYRKIKAVNGTAIQILSPTDSTYTNAFSIAVSWTIGGKVQDTLKLQSLKLGSNTITRLARDEAGNLFTASVIVFVDTTSPLRPVVKGPSRTASKTPTWTWSTGGGGGSGNFKYWLDVDDAAQGKETKDTLFTPATELSEALHTLFVSERDAAGNWSSAGRFSITIDVSGPTAPKVSTTPSSPTNVRKPKWIWSSGGNGGIGAYQYRLDNPIFNSGATPTSDTVFIPTTNLSHGIHTLYVQEKDSAGNWSATGSGAVIIDTVAPDAPKVTSLSASPTNNALPTWNWTSGGNGGRGYYRYKLGDTLWADGGFQGAATTFTPASALAEGVRSLFVEEQDSAGNWSSPGSLVLAIDMTPPAAPKMDSTPYSPLNSLKPIWTWKSGGGGNGTFRCRVDNPDLSTGTVTVTQSTFAQPTDLSEGRHVLYVQERDAAGNWSELTFRSLLLVLRGTVGNAGFTSGPVVHPSLSISRTDVPFIAFQDGANAYKTTVMKWNGISWESVGISGFSPGYASSPTFSLNSSGTPFIAFTDGANGNKASMMQWNGSSWENVGSPGFSAGTVANLSMAISGDVPYIAFTDNANGGRATLMRWSGVSWITVGDPGFSSGATEALSLSLNDNGVPYVAYRDRANGNKATVMRWSGVQWAAVGGPGFTSGQVEDLSFALNGSGVPFIAYIDSENGNKPTVMRWNGSIWEPVGKVGFTTGAIGDLSLAVDKMGVPYIICAVIFPRICVAKERMLNHGYQTEDGIGTGKAASPEVRRGIQA